MNLKEKLNDLKKTLSDWCEKHPITVSIVQIAGAIVLVCVGYKLAKRFWNSRNIKLNFPTKKLKPVKRPVSSTNSMVALSPDLVSRIADASKWTLETWKRSGCIVKLASGQSASFMAQQEALRNGIVLQKGYTYRRSCNCRHSSLV